MFNVKYLVSISLLNERFNKTIVLVFVFVSVSVFVFVFVWFEVSFLQIDDD